MLSGYGFQLLGRMAYFVIVAHALGPAGYGSFVACTALIGTMSPFASCGTGHIMIKNVARDRSWLPVYLGNALLVTVVLGTVLTVVALFLRPLVLPSSSTSGMLLAVAIADLFGLQINNICLQVFLAFEQGRRYSQLMELSTGVRFVAAIILIAGTPTAAHWAYLYAASAMLAAASTIIVVSWCCTRPKFQLTLILSSVREGFHFATSLASQSIYDDIDKTMLARLSTVESAAIYAVAYRFIDAAMLPIQSLAAAVYPEFFRQGMHGVSCTFTFARRILRRAAVYGTGTAVALFLAAGLVPFIMGTGYRESAVALRWLCLLPAIKSVHAFLTDTLTGANYQWQRSSAQIGVAVFNILVNLWLIPAFSWRGAAWSSLVTDSLFAVLLYMIIRRYLRRERVVSQLPNPEPIPAGQR